MFELLEIYVKHKKTIGIVLGIAYGLAVLGKAIYELLH
jgi:hypothetical protein